MIENKFCSTALVIIDKFEMSLFFAGTDWGGAEE